MHQRQMMSDAVLNDKTDQVSEFIDIQVAEGKITEEQAKEYNEIMQDYQELSEQADILNVRGKNALFRNHTTDAYLTEVLEEKYNDLQEQFALVDADDNLTDIQKRNRKIEYQMKYDRDTKGMRYGIAQSRANKANLIMGKAADEVVNVKWNITKNGDIIPEVGLSQSDYKLYVQDSDEDILSGKSKTPSRFGSLPKVLSGKAKSVYAKIKDTLFPSEQAKEDETTEDGATGESNEENPENAQQEGTTGSDTTTDETDSENLSEEPVDTTKVRSKLSPEEQEEYDQLLEDQGIAKETAEKADQQIAKAEKAIAEGKIKPESLPRALEIIEGLKKDSQAAKDQQAATKKEVDAYQKKADEREEAPEGEQDPNLDEDAPKTFKAAKDAEKLNPNILERIANKIKGGVKLSKDQQAIVDKFADSFDNVINKTKDAGNDFYDYMVGGQFDKKVKAAKKKAKAKTKSSTSNATQAAKNAWNSPLVRGIRQKTASALDLYSPSEDLWGPGKESREGVMAESELAELLKEQSTNFVEGVGMYQYGPANVDIMMAVNERMSTVFPKMEKKPRVIILDNLRKAIGIRGVGYTAGAMVYVQRNKWNQGKTFMHEMAHVFYALAKDEPQTKAIIQEALKNKALIDKVLKRYPDAVLYDYTTPEGETIRGALDPVHYKKNAKQLADMNVKVAPLEEQHTILEEVFVHYLQGPLSEKYNNFFSPRNEYKRQKLVTKWWNPIATKIEENRAEMDQENLLKKLQDQTKEELTPEDGVEIATDKKQVKKGVEVKPGQDFSLGNMRDYIVQKFKEEVGPI
ncbi:MAG: hypothetical protein EX254_09230, partial [Flavobacteriaceae bacterium]